MTQEHSDLFQVMDPKAVARAFRKATKALKRGDIIIIKVAA